MYPEFVETPSFTRRADEILGEEGLRALGEQLAANPHAGVVIRGGGGIRKVRVGVTGRGRRGGARVIYFYADWRGRVLLLDIYRKNQRDDLTPRELAGFKAVVAAEFPE
jgi:hypothetical protein